MTNLNKLIWLIRMAFLCGLALSTSQCAKEVAPTGGPKDTVAPKVLRMKPANESLHFKSKRILITFDEFVDLVDLEKNLLISPPLAVRPTIWKRGKSIVIQIPDTLLVPDKTYSLSFSKAIKDLNEGNMLDRLVYAFSTGSVIDTLRVKGKLQNASDLKAPQNTFVMLYRNTADSAPRKTLPDYITRSMADGSFEISNIAPGSYRLFALRDTNRNYRFDQPSEMIGYMNELVTPTATRSIQTDTIHRDSIATKKLANGKIAKDTIKRDTIITHAVTHFAPDTLKMMIFEEQSGLQYIDANVRERKEKLVFTFKRPLYDDTVRITPLDSTIAASRLFIEYNQTHDTVVCWLRDTVLRNNDTLKVLVHYKAPDTSEQLVWRVDTLKPRYETRKDRFKGRLALRAAFSAKNNSTLNMGDDLKILTSTPIMSFVPDSITLEQVTDTTALQQSCGAFYKLDSAKNEKVDSIVMPPIASAPFDDKTDPQTIMSYRLGRSKFALSFLRPIGGTIHITPANKPDAVDWMISEIDAPSKTIICWSKDKDIFKKDKPRISVRYQRNGTDTTVQIDLSKRQKGQKRNLSANKSMQARLALSISKIQEEALPIDQQLLLTASNPIAQFDTSKIRLISMPDSARIPLRSAIIRSIRTTRQLCIAGEWKKAKSYLLLLKDSACVDIWGTASKETEIAFKTETLHGCFIAKDMKRSISRDSTKLTLFKLNAKWEEKKRYRVKIKRGTFVDLYGKRNDTAQVVFSIPDKTTYGKLTLVIQGVKQASIIQLLNKDGKTAVKEVFITKDSTISWPYMTPGDYPIKAIVDANRNKKWDAGNFKHRRQPEAISFSPKPATVKANWESKQIWNLLDKASATSDSTNAKTIQKK